MRPCPAGLACGVFLLLTGSAGAHTVQQVVEPDAVAVVVRFAWSGGTAVRSAGFRLFGPGDAEPWLTGRSDSVGRIAFVPDRAGPWRIELQADPEHRVTQTVEVTPELAAVAPTSWARAALTGSLAANAALLWLLWPLRRHARRLAGNSIRPTTLRS